VSQSEILFTVFFYLYLKIGFMFETEISSQTHRMTDHIIISDIKACR